MGLSEVFIFDEELCFVRKVSVNGTFFFYCSAVNFFRKTTVIYYDRRKKEGRTG